MIGRGTRLCEKLIDGEDKAFFLIFDYCNNFEFFEMNPEGISISNGKSLSQKLYDVTDIDNLAVFIRSIVGVEQDAINQKFGMFLNENVLNSQQQEFVKAIIDYVRENGDICTEDLIEKSPFDNYDIVSLFGSNITIVTSIVNQIHKSILAA